MAVLEWRSRTMEQLNCRRCRDRGVISVRHGTIYETDSDDEIALAYHDEPCPDCRTQRAMRDAAAALYFALECLLNRSDEADRCGAHCSNSCKWCNARNALAIARGETNGAAAMPRKG